MVQHLDIQDLTEWSDGVSNRIPYSFDMELTARCNNDCRHCYINLPAGDRAARHAELSVAEIDRIAAEAVELGALWCLVSGGEPLLRPDFEEIYLTLKRRGLLISVFTNGTAVTERHARLFRDYPPRDIEITVYGATAATYDRVARKPGMYKKFIRGLEILRAHDVPVRLKAMVLRSNLAEQPAIQAFCHTHGKDFARFDPTLHLRYDRCGVRNAEIEDERLSVAEMAAFEQSLPGEHHVADQSPQTGPGGESFNAPDALLRCSAGTRHFSIGYDGTFRLCQSLWAPGTTYDLRQGSVREAWETFIPKVLGLKAGPQSASCWSCSHADVCFWCPARAYLETGDMEGRTPEFCAQAHAKAARMGEMETVT